MLAKYVIKRFPGDCIQEETGEIGHKQQRKKSYIFGRKKHYKEGGNVCQGGHISKMSRSQPPTLFLPLFLQFTSFLIYPHQSRSHTINSPSLRRIKRNTKKSNTFLKTPIERAYYLTRDTCKITGIKNPTSSQKS